MAPKLLGEALEAALCELRLGSGVDARGGCSVQTVVGGSEMIHIVYIGICNGIISLWNYCSLECVVMP